MDVKFKYNLLGVSGDFIENEYKSLDFLKDG